MTDTHDNNLSATAVIRCVYLARVAGRRGDDQTARRWQAKADTWLARQKLGAVSRPFHAQSAGKAASAPSTLLRESLTLSCETG
jgi:hypothetical protein